MESQSLLDHNQYQLKIKSRNTSSENAEPSLSKPESEIIENYLSLKTPELLKLPGDSGWFQKRTITILAFIVFFGSFIQHELPFVFFAPSFSCKDKNNNLFSCTEKEACLNSFGYKVHFGKTSMVSDFNIYCENKYLETNGQTFLFFVSGVLVMGFSILNDFIGRLPTFYFSGLLIVFGCLLSYLSTGYYAIIIGMAISFTAVDLCGNTIFIYTNEVIGSLKRI